MDKFIKKKDCKYFKIREAALDLAKMNITPTAHGFIHFNELIFQVIKHHF